MNLTTIVVLTTVAIELGKARKAKTDSDRAEHVFNVIETLVQTYRHEDGFLDKLKALVN